MEALSNIIPFAIIFGVFWLLVWKPQRDEEQRHKALLDSLAKDDRVVTDAGMHGRVTKVDEGTVELEIAKGTRVVFDKTKVVRRQGDVQADG